MSRRFSCRSAGCLFLKVLSDPVNNESSHQCMIAAGVRGAAVVHQSHIHIHEPSKMLRSRNLIHKLTYHYEKKNLISVLMPCSYVLM